MVSENNDEQKIRWQKIKKELQGKLEKNNEVKPSKFDKLTDQENFNNINNREYPVGAESIFVEAEKTKDMLDAEERKKLASLQISIKKISEVLKKAQLESPTDDLAAAPARELTINMPKEHWDFLFSGLKRIKDGEQPTIYTELAEFIIEINQVINEYIDVILPLLNNNNEQHLFSKILSSSYLSVVKRDSDASFELIIIRFSRSQRKLVTLYMDELPNEKEKKELLVSFLLGQSPKFLITNKEAKKIAFQKSIANKKLKS